MDASQINNYTQNQKEPYHFEKRDYLYISDTSGGNYQNQIQFDTSAWQNSSQYTCLSDAYISLPWSLTITPYLTQGNLVTTHSTPGVVFKNDGYMQLINSALINLNGQAVNQQNQGLNIKNTFDKMMSWNHSKALQAGSSTMFAMDSSDSGTFTPNQGVVSSVNNKVTIGPHVNPWVMTSAWNEGLQQRAKWMYQSNQQSTHTSVTVNAVTGVQVVSGYALLPLSCIHDVFSCLDFPLRNIRLQLYLNINSFNLTTSINGGVITNYNLLSSGQGFSCPFMVTDQFPAAINATSTASTVGQGTAVLALGAMTGLGASRLYFPNIKLDPTTEKKLLTDSTKAVCFEDFQLFQLPNTSANNSINWPITSGVQNLKKIYLFCYAAAGTAAGTGGPSSLFSITGTDGVMPTPGIVLNNIMLSLNGQNFLSNPIQYDFEQFIHNMSLLNTGGIFDKSSFVINSGLISQYDFNNSYKIYCFDVTRNESISTQDVPISVQLIATNQSAFAIDIHAYCVFESSIVIDQKSQTLTTVKSFQNQSKRS